MVAAAIVAEKSVPRVRIDFHLKRHLLRRQFGFDLVNVIHGNQLIFSPEEKVHWALDLTCARKRARVSQGNTAAVIGRGAFYGAVMMCRGQISKPSTHAKADHA